MAISETPPEPATERITRSSATAAGGAATARNPRRRARQSDNDTLQKAAPRRKRSKISAETYAPRQSIEVQPPAAVTASDSHEKGRPNSLLHGNGNGVVHLNGHHTLSAVGTATTAGKVSGNRHLHPPQHRRTVSTTSVLDGDIAVRGGKKGTVKRVHKADGATTLCSNQCYSAKLLPSTPKQLKKEGLQYRGSILDGHALAVTEKNALVWEYNAHVTASNARVFVMPFPTRAGELPLGALVPSNTIGHHDLGLVLISTTSGRVAFYESIDRATSLGLFQGKGSGVEGTIPLNSNEMVTDIVSAAYAAFVVTLSSGRVVALSLKDNAGSPKVQCEFLRILEPASGGAFGSFSSFFKPDFRRDLTAVRTRATRRGHVQVVGLTEKAELLLWDLEWSGRSDYISNVELRDSLTRELIDAVAPELAGQVEHAVALDLAISDKQSDSSTQALTSASAVQPLDILILLRMGASDMQSYVVAEISLPGDGSHSIDRIHQLRYQSDGPVSMQQKPRLTLPKPGHTFYVVFEDAAILAATADLVDDSPEAQLHASYFQQEPFEDAIRLKSGKNLAFLGVSDEPPRASNSSIVAFVKGAGLVRISALDTQTAPGGPRISARSRIEQAVFHGILQQDNIVDFSAPRGNEHSIEEVEQATVDISGEILRAETNFPQIITPTPASMEAGLATKARALKALVTFVVRAYPALPAKTMWQLLWDAEKLAAAQQLWLAFEEHVALTSKGEKRKATVMDELTSWFEASFAFYHRPDLASEDTVRRFFSGGLDHMDKLLTNLRVLLQAFYEQEDCTPSEGLKRVIQTDDIWLRALETAFNFRSEHCADYGIMPEHIEDGILIDTTEYTELSEFWTSSPRLVENTLHIAILSRALAKKHFEPEQVEQEVHDMVKDVAENNGRLVQIYCLQAQESINWYASRNDKRLQELSEKMRMDYDLERYKQFRELADVGRADAGMLLAEKYRDMDTLADMIIAEDQYLQDYRQEHNAVKEQVLQFATDLRQKIQRYFHKYQKDWSDAFFGKLFASGAPGAKLLRAQQEWQQPLTEYLRGRSDTVKLCWINDVTAESDYAHASEALMHCAQEQETKLWNKRVELSLAKLALLAAEEAGPLNQRAKLKINGTINPLRSASDELAIVNVQDQLYKHLKPEIERSLDVEAEVVNCMNRFGNRVEEDTPLARILAHGIANVVQHCILDIEELIDTLTLMTVVIDPTHDENFQGSETLHALTALEAVASTLPPSRFETLLALIWKRAYIYDDWTSPELQVTKKKSDEERKSAIQSSFLWQSLHHILESDIITKPDAQIRILTPSECINAACRTEHITHRFPDRENLDSIVHDLQKQDELLSGYVNDWELDQIAAGAVRDVQGFLMAKADEEAEIRRQERDLQATFSEGELASSNGHVVAPNGVLKREETDEDGDVEME